jgi:hypothetical protein
MTQAIVAIGVALGVGAATLSMSSPQGAFSMLNHIQLFILLPMIGAYLPKTVIDLITGMSFAMFSFSFIPFEKIPMIDSLFNVFDYDQSDDYFDNIGLTSGSAFLNHIALLIIVGVFILFHLSILPCYKASLALNEGNWAKWVMVKIFNIMSFSIYIRILLEAYLLISLSTISELNEFDHSNGFRIFSLSMSLIFAILLTTMLLLFLFQMTIYSKVHPSKIQWCLREFIAGMKISKLSQIYTIIFMSIRISFVVTIVVFSDLQRIFKTLILSLLQLVFTTYLITVRPFEQFKDNLIEICNQTIFLIAVGSLIHFDTKPEWNSILEK